MQRISDIFFVQLSLDVDSLNIYLVFIIFDKCFAWFVNGEMFWNNLRTFARVRFIEIWRLTFANGLERENKCHVMHDVQLIILLADITLKVTDPTEKFKAIYFLLFLRYAQLANN